MKHVSVSTYHRVVKMRLDTDALGYFIRMVGYWLVSSKAYAFQTEFVQCACLTDNVRDRVQKTICCLQVSLPIRCCCYCLCLHVILRL